MRYIKYIVFSAVLLFAFQANAQVEAVLSIENETVVNGNYEFSIMVRTASNTAGPLYLGNADFVFNYNRSLFTNPTFGKINNTTDLVNSQGQDATVNLLIDLNLSTDLNEVADNAVLGDMLIVNLNGINPGDNNALINNVPRVDGTSCVYKIGEFRITGLNDPTTVDAGLTWVTSGPIPTDVYSYNTTNLDGEQANLEFERGECPPTSLPIEMLEFTGDNRGDYNLLAWKTSTEQNSSHFEVQRSFNASDFTRIGQVQAAGNSLQVRSYDFQDNEPYIGMSYYRLKIVDTDGSYTYSNVVAVPMKLRDNTAVFPVPTSDVLSLVYDAEVAGEITVNVVDALGKILMTNVENTAPGFNQFRYDVSQLPVGAYFMNIVDGSQAPIVRPFIRK